MNFKTLFKSKTLDEIFDIQNIKEGKCYVDNKYSASLTFLLKEVETLGFVFVPTSDTSSFCS